MYKRNEEEVIDYVKECMYIKDARYGRLLVRYVTEIEKHLHRCLCSLICFSQIVVLRRLKHFRLLIKDVHIIVNHCVRCNASF
jgi:hypothetical protein